MNTKRSLYSHPECPLRCSTRLFHTFCFGVYFRGIFYVLPWRKLISPTPMGENVLARALLRNSSTSIEVSTEEVEEGFPWKLTAILLPRKIPSTSFRGSFHLLPSMETSIYFHLLPSIPPQGIPSTYFHGSFHLLPPKLPSIPR